MTYPLVKFGDDGDSLGRSGLTTQHQKTVPA